MSRFTQFAHPQIINTLASRLQSPKTEAPLVTAQDFVPYAEQPVIAVPKSRTANPNWVLHLMAFVLLIGGLMEFESPRVGLFYKMACPLIITEYHQSLGGGNDKTGRPLAQQRCFWVPGSL